MSFGGEVLMRVHDHNVVSGMIKNLFAKLKNNSQMCRFNKNSLICIAILRSLRRLPVLRLVFVFGRMDAIVKPTRLSGKN